MCFSCIKFGFWCDLALEDVCKFSKRIKFSVPKGANRVDGAGFFSALIGSVSAWLAALAEEINGIMVFSGNNPTVSAISSALVL